MPIIETNGIEICFEDLGPPEGEPLLLVMGLGSQLVRWPEKFRRALADRGLRLVVFDNRDVGLSTHFHDAGAPDFGAVLRATAAGQRPDLPYGLDDMADDCVGLLDALELERAHVLGVSMGGMIVQALAIRHGHRVRSMTSIMSTTGDPSVPPGRPDVVARLMTPRAKSRAEAVEQALETDRAIGSRVFPFEEDVYRARAERAYDRCFDPEGVARQMAAVMAHGDRSAALGAVDVPTLVIHGSDDPLVHPEGGRATARSIPGARLLEIEGMAHDLPAPVHDRIGDAGRDLTRLGGA